MTKRSILAGITAIGVAGLLTASAEARDLVYGTPLPPKHIINSQAMAPMFERLKGKLNWQLVAGGQLFESRTALQSVGNAIADGTVIVPSYFQSQLPNASIPFNTVLMGRHELVNQGAVEELLLLDCPECKEDYKRSGALYLGGYAAGGMALICNKEVTKLEDVAGKKARTSGAIGRWASRLGATPVSMTISDMVEAINRGQIDCIMGFTAWYKSYPVQDAVKWIYNYNVGSTAAVGFLVMNANSWKGLGDEEKRALWAELPRASADAVMGYVKEAFEARDLAEKNGVTFTNADFDRIDKIWAEHKKAEYEEIIASSKKAGSKNPQAILDNYLAKLDKWTKIIEEAGLTGISGGASEKPRDFEGATKKLAELLDQHIYGKIDPTKY